jgi:hypothetical protein
MPPKRGVGAAPAAAAAAAAAAAQRGQGSSSSSSSSAVQQLQSRESDDATDPSVGLNISQLSVLAGVPKDIMEASTVAPVASSVAGGAEYSAVLNKVGQAGVDNRSSTNDEEEGEVVDDNESGQPAHADSSQPKKKRKSRVEKVEECPDSTLSSKLHTLSRSSFSPALLKLGAVSVASKLVNKLWSKLMSTDPFATEARLLQESAVLFRDCLEGRVIAFDSFWKPEGSYLGGKPYVFRLFRDKRINVMQIIVRCCDPSACHM